MISTAMRLCGIVAALLALSVNGRATQRIWTGGSALAYWSHSGNWQGNQAPSAGDDLLFPAGAANLSNTNDYSAGSGFNSITISGTNYSLYGAAINLTAGIDASGTTVANYFNIPITLLSDQTITTGNATVNLYLYGAIDTNGKNLTFAGNGFAQVPGVISGAGGLIKTGSGGLLLYASNSFSGAVDLQQGTLNLYDPNALGTTNGSTTIEAGTTLTLASSISTGTPLPEPFVLGGTLVSLAVVKTLTGPMTLISSSAVINGPLTINGLISGSGGFSKISSETLTFNADNTYTGATTINQGALLVNGNQPASPIVFPGASFAAGLGGTGTVGTITASGLSAKSIAPGNGGRGVLTCSNLALDSVTTIELGWNGTNAGSYGQLNVRGSVALGNAALQVVLSYTPGIGESFTAINNDGAEPVSGTFGGANEGAVLSENGYPVQISYAGGTGNDVVLTRISPPTQFTSIVAQTNGTMAVEATGGLPGFNYTIQFATNLGPSIQWSNLGVVPATSQGIVAFIDSYARQSPVRFYRVVSP